MEEKSLHISFIQYVAIGYNIIEAFFAILFGIWANSIALVGFGLGSFGESLAGMIIIRRFDRIKLLAEQDGAKLRKKPTIIVALVFFVFATFVLIRAIVVLMHYEPPHPSLAGMVLALISLITMPVLEYWNHRGENNLSKSFLSSIKEVWGFMLLSLGLLIGLGLNYFLGIWRFDPAIGLISALFLYKKSLEGLIAEPSSPDVIPYIPKDEN